MCFTIVSLLDFICLSDKNALAWFRFVLFLNNHDATPNTRWVNLGCQFLLNVSNISSLFLISHFHTSPLNTICHGIQWHSVGIRSRVTVDGYPAHTICSLLEWVCLLEVIPQPYPTDNQQNVNNSLTRQTIPDSKPISLVPINLHRNENSPRDQLQTASKPCIP